MHHKGARSVRKHANDSFLAISNIFMHPTAPNPKQTVTQYYNLLQSRKICEKNKSVRNMFKFCRQQPKYVLIFSKHTCFFRMAVNDRRRRRAKDQPCFSNSGSRKRVLSQLSKWQKCCLLPGNIAQSWLVQLENEN